MKYLLGQGLLLHPVFSVVDLAQLFPPCWGDGLVQDLDLDQVPPPQLTEQWAQELQVDQCPSTERKLHMA